MFIILDEYNLNLVENGDSSYKSHFKPLHGIQKNHTYINREI